MNTRTFLKMVLVFPVVCGPRLAKALAFTFRDSAFLGVISRPAGGPPPSPPDASLMDAESGGSDSDFAMAGNPPTHPYFEVRSKGPLDGTTYQSSGIVAYGVLAFTATAMNPGEPGVFQARWGDSNTDQSNWSAWTADTSYFGS